MTSPNLDVLRAAIAAVRADLTSDAKEDPKTQADRRDVSDDRRLLAALDAVDRSLNGGQSQPQNLKEAAGKAREVFAQSRKDAQSADVSN